jgi:hypothetical protein
MAITAGTLEVQHRPKEDHLTMRLETLDEEKRKKLKRVFRRENTGLRWA